MGTSSPLSRYTSCVPDDMDETTPGRGSEAADVELLCLDVDGVLTDGSIIIDSAGNELKRFSVRDGLAIKAWLREGHQIAVITGRGCEALRRRMDELGIEIVIEGASEKGPLLTGLLDKLGIPASKTAFMGDDLPDLPAFEVCGYPMAPADAESIVLEKAVWVSKRRGGAGAVREAIEHLMRARGTWDDVVAKHLDMGHLL